MVIQIFVMATKQQKANLKFDEQIKFWKWVNKDILAVVTKSNVYHIDIENGGQKVLFFARGKKLAEPGVQIIDYNLGASGVWAALVCISTKDKITIDGDIQLYNNTKKQSMFIQGHSSTFGFNKVHNASFKSQLFAFVKKERGQTSATIQISEVDPPAIPAGQKKFKKQQSIQYTKDSAKEFPVVMHVSEKHGLLYIVTKHGCLYVYEIPTCNWIQKTQISESTIFIGTVNR